MAVLLLGYDVECTWKLGVTKAFLTKLKVIHQALQAPCSLFITGQTLNNNKKICRDLRHNALFDFQQHTYSHIPLKPTIAEKRGKPHALPGASAKKIETEVARTNALMKQVLDVDCIGLTAPFGYYQGLSDRPDILRILYDSGIRFTRSYGRNEQGGQPVSFQVHPFWYPMPAGKAILELPIHGWQDCIWRSKYGWRNTHGYLRHLTSNIDRIAGTNLTWCCLHHDWSSLRHDRDMTILRAFIAYAQNKGVELMTYKDYYQRERANRRPF